MAGMIASGRRKAAKLKKKAQLTVKFSAEDLAEAFYVDHYGNLVTGLRAGAVPRERALVVSGRQIPYARAFSQVAAGEVFWYENSLGLVEIAANAASAVERLGLRVGRLVALEPG